MTVKRVLRLYTREIFCVFILQGSSSSCPRSIVLASSGVLLSAVWQKRFIQKLSVSVRWRETRHRDFWLPHLAFNAAAGQRAPPDLCVWSACDGDRGDRHHSQRDVVMISYCYSPTNNGGDIIFSVQTRSAAFSRFLMEINWMISRSIISANHNTFLGIISLTIPGSGRGWWSHWLVSDDVTVPD